jgi:hypothetical protein
MTNSAENRGMREPMLAHSLGLYRDLSEALSTQIAQLQAEQGDSKDLEDAVKAHRRILQTALEIGASLVKRSEANADRPELDLDAARAEIAERLARRLVGG